MYIKKRFNILLYFTFFILLTGCINKERLNPNDPLYEQETIKTNIITIISNINVTINYSNTVIIDGDTTWKNIFGQPIKIIQNILITKGATLTIERGTEIQLFAIGPSGSPGIVGIIVDDGALNAIGTSGEPIEFIAQDGAQAYIVFRKNSLDSGCILEYCDLNHYLGGIYVYCIAAKPLIQNNKIMDIVLASSSDITLQFNKIETLLCEDSSPVIKNNKFPLTLFDKSIFIKGDSYATINNNNIEGGTLYCITNNSQNTQVAINNYWGSSISNIIKGKISGPIKYKPFYTNKILGIGVQLPPSGW